MCEVVRVQIGDSLDNLPVELPLERVRRFACLQVEKERSLIGILEDQNVFRAHQLFRHFITLKANFFLILKSPNHMLMVKIFQDAVFVFKMLLFFLR